MVDRGQNASNRQRHVCSWPQMPTGHWNADEHVDNDITNSGGAQCYCCCSLQNCGFKTLIDQDLSNVSRQGFNCSLFLSPTHWWLPVGGAGKRAGQGDLRTESGNHYSKKPSAAVWWVSASYTPARCGKLRTVKALLQSCYHVSWHVLVSGAVHNEIFTG